MSEPQIICSRCKRPHTALEPLPKWLRFFMPFAAHAFPNVFDRYATYCRKCRRAMLTPTIILVLFGIFLISIPLLRYLGLIR